MVGAESPSGGTVSGGNKCRSGKANLLVWQIAVTLLRSTDAWVYEQMNLCIGLCDRSEIPLLGKRTRTRPLNCVRTRGYVWQTKEWLNATRRVEVGRAVRFVAKCNRELQCDVVKGY